MGKGWGRGGLRVEGGATNVKCELWKKSFKSKPKLGTMDESWKMECLVGLGKAE